MSRFRLAVVSIFCNERRLGKLRDAFQSPQDSSIVGGIRPYGDRKVADHFAYRRLLPGLRSRMGLKNQAFWVSTGGGEGVFA